MASQVGYSVLRKLSVLCAVLRVVSVVGVVVFVVCLSSIGGCAVFVVALFVVVGLVGFLVVAPNSLRKADWFALYSVCCCSVGSWYSEVLLDEFDWRCCSAFSCV